MLYKFCLFWYMYDLIKNIYFLLFSPYVPFSLPIEKFHTFYLVLMCNQRSTLICTFFLPVEASVSKKRKLQWRPLKIPFLKVLAAQIPPLRKFVISAARNASGRQAWTGSAFRNGFRVRELPHQRSCPSGGDPHQMTDRGGYRNARPFQPNEGQCQQVLSAGTSACACLRLSWDLDQNSSTPTVKPCFLPFLSTGVDKSESISGSFPENTICDIW